MSKLTFQCVDDEEADKARVGPPDNKRVGSRERAIQRLALLKRVWESKEASIHRWQQAIETAKSERAWEPLGYPTLNAMLQAELNVADEDEAEREIRLRDKRGNPTGSNQYQVKVSPENNTEERLLGNNSSVTNKRDRGNSNEYRIARIARDRPDILDRMKAGEFPSVRQAAIAAGIVKVPTPLEVAVKAVKKLDADELGEFAEWFTNYHPTP